MTRIISDKVRVIVAKFPGSCRWCQGEIRPGDLINWVQGNASTHKNPVRCEEEKARLLARAAGSRARPAGELFRNEDGDTVCALGDGRVRTATTEEEAQLQDHEAKRDNKLAAAALWAPGARRP